MRIVLALSLAALATPALAQRPDATRMTCQQASQMVLREGAIVMGLGGDKYDRLVRDEGFCLRGQETRPLFTPTRDNPTCMIGYYCRERIYEPR
jgi:hypothetical protein